MITLLRIKGSKLFYKVFISYKWVESCWLVDWWKSIGLFKPFTLSNLSFFLGSNWFNRDESFQWNEGRRDVRYFN